MREAHVQFNGYISAISTDAAGAYLNGCVFPALDGMARRARSARNAYMILMSVVLLMMLLIPILLLLQHSLLPHALNLALAGIAVCASGIVFAVVLLRLPQKAARESERVRQLETVLHAYFLRVDEFAGEDEEKRLQLLHSKADKLL